jgi:hypothetical protein
MKFLQFVLVVEEDQQVVEVREHQVLVVVD